MYMATETKVTQTWRAAVTHKATKLRNFIMLGSQNELGLISLLYNVTKQSQPIS